MALQSSDRPIKTRRSLRDRAGPGLLHRMCAINLVHSPHRRQLNAHWPDPDAAWRARADHDALEAGFAAWWRAQAFAIWRATRPVKGTPAESYLRRHGIHQAPPSIRFHAKLEHPASLRFHVKLAHPHSTAGAWPALVALITDGRSGLPLGVHAIFLSRDGSSLAPIRQPAVTLGVCNGGVVRLGEPSGQPAGVLMVGIGLETCLRVAQDTGDPAWAALSERGLAELDLPPGPGVMVLGDDTAASQALAWKLRSQKRRVVIVSPPLEAESCGCPHPPGRPGVNYQ
jgi:hypothetical protein